MLALVLGRRGYLAERFRKGFQERGASIVWTNADVCDPEDMRQALIGLGPKDVVINAAGKTHSATSPTIDGCEDSRLSEQETHRVNVEGARVVRDACAKHDVPLIHLGSGCIFDGYSERFTEESAPNPVSFYAKTKVEADRLVSEYPGALILRLRLPVSDDQHPRNTLVKLADYEAVVDARNSVTDVQSLVTAAWHLLKGARRGIFNVVNPGPVSPYDMAREMGQQPQRLTAAQLNKLCVAARSNCVLSTTKLESTGVKLIPARVAIAHHIARLRREFSYTENPSARHRVVI